MDVQTFLGNLTNLGHILERAPHLLCAKCAMVDGVPHIVFAFNTEPKVHVEDFDSEAKCDLWWSEFIRIMSGMCQPPCIVVNTILFQPTYLFRAVCHSNETAHFVILDFGNNRNLSLGFHQREQQISLYAALIQALGPDFQVRNKKLPI